MAIVMMTTSDAVMEENAESADGKAANFLRQIVEDDIASGKNGGKVVTRFPPEPNGYLHIGHAKAICISFMTARDYAGGVCHLRFDDTNPIKEEQEFIDAIKEDIAWLGFDWGEHEYYASDYFQQLYDWAVLLIEAGKAYVDDLNAEEMREYRGTLTAPGKASPFRERSVAENLDLLARMRAGEFENGSKVLRAKIEMSSPNMNLRDPAMYRVQKAVHPRVGDAWCIYPMYDWAHGQSDWIEGITNSLCSLEFEDHRPLYDWFVQTIMEAGGKPEGVEYAPRQTEFARLNISQTITQKRKLRELVEEGLVSGWDDPRMPTLRGMRKRGYSPSAIQLFCERVGIAKRNHVIQMAFFEHVQREILNKVAVRRMAVLDPLKVVITNFPEDESAVELEAVNNPEDAGAGTRTVLFSKELYIERADFMEDAPKKFFRLTVGKEVRLRYAFFITCTEAIKDADGNVVELRCTYDPATKGGDAPDGRKVKGTLHWVSAAHALKAEVRLYDHLFTKDDPNELDEAQAAAGLDFKANVNPDSLQVLTDCWVEPALGKTDGFETVQFERTGYFCRDAESEGERLIFNRTVSLKDSWGKKQKGGGGGQQKKK